MSNATNCPECGVALPANWPTGLCSRCALQGALELRNAESQVLHPGQPGLKQAAKPFATEKPGDRIGHYKLLQQIGEGGCGIVYMAEQEAPVRRRVALKIIKLGMDTRQVITRFEAERQALALMDHPNIARVFDAGATETGRPYFVMELVRGVKITDYCDENHLSTRERLDLFMEVCRAIQHAHQKGIIHRDIKPSNILVTVNDGVPVPKVIDFGVAKATQGRLTDQTLFTAFEQFIGTPAYMSPEQAVMTSLDVDTRSDIYSLGVLLYELLTGKTPFDSKELLASGLDEIRRTIREKEPPKPSTRLTQELVAADVRRLHSKSETQNPNFGVENGASSRRLLQVKKLIHLLRGDLDWIVMKCLEKDRTRRYETANGLAVDLQRHLNNEPVVARPPSNLYRFQKLVRRKKLVFAAAGAVAAALIIGLGLSTWLLIKEREARQRVIAAENAIGQLYSLAFLFQDQGKLAEAETVLREGLTATRILAQDARPDVAHALNDLAEVLSSRGKLSEAEALQREALAMQSTFFGEKDLAVADTLAALTSTLLAGGRFAEAESVARKCLSIHERKRLDDWRAFDARSLLGGCFLGQTNYVEAEPLLLSGFEGMKHREEKIPTNWKVRLKEALARLVELYQKTGRPERVAELRKNLQRLDSVEARRQQEACARQFGLPLEYTNSIGMTFRLVPNGEFQMGSADDDVKALERGDWFFSGWAVERIKSERPRHRVRITRPFGLGSHEVTVGQFRRFLTASSYKTKAERTAKGGFGFADGDWLQGIEFNWANPGYAQEDDHPVGNIAWDDAKEFCQWLGKMENRTYRLPTEAEWEFACRAGTQTLFHSGDGDEDLREAANVADAALQLIHPQVRWSRAWNDGYPFAAPVGRFKPNAFGLHDMHGNVWEWCVDFYDPEYYRESPIADPLCRGPNSFHVFRGGGWDNYPGFCRSTDRYSSHSPTLRTEWAGFRVVLEFADRSSPGGAMQQ